jgi:PKD repeat protein
MKISFLLGVACALALGASTAQAQNKLTTIFASNNGLSGSSMVFFDVTVTNPVRLTGFELNSYATANSALDLQVYTCATTYVGNETNAAAWTQIAQDNGTAVGAGQDLPSVVPLQSAVLLPAGTYGMALVSNQGHRYTNGNGSNQAYSDSFLSLQLGASASASTPFTSSPITPRVWNGSIVYTPAAGIYANFTATPVEGKSPLQVQFTDTTFTDDPAGVAKYEWDFNNDQIVDSTAQNPQFTFTGVGYDLKYTVSLKATDVQNGSSTETKKDFIIVNPFPVASATQFGQGSTVPGGVPGPMQMPAFSNTYSWPTDTRGFWGQAPTTFVITGFNVPNENQDTHHSVWFFTYSGTGTPGSTYNVTATDTKFIGSGPISATLKPQTPITVTQGTWFGCLGTTHDATGTTMSNSYAASGTQQTTILGSPVSLNRLTHTGSISRTARAPARSPSRPPARSPAS